MYRCLYLMGFGNDVERKIIEVICRRGLVSSIFDDSDVEFSDILGMR